MTPDVTPAEHPGFMGLAGVAQKSERAAGSTLIERYGPVLAGLRFRDQRSKSCAVAYWAEHLQGMTWA
jgi:hypothetical protein